MPGFKVEYIQHEIFGDVLEHLDSRRRSEFDSLALERSFPENKSVVTHSLDVDTIDDDGIVGLDFQQTFGFNTHVRFQNPAIGSTSDLGPIVSGWGSTGWSWWT